MRMARPGSSGIRGKFGPFTLYFLLLPLTDPDQTFKPNLAGQKRLFQHILEKERAAVTACSEPHPLFWQKPVDLLLILMLGKLSCG